MIPLIESSLHLSIPLILAAMGGLLCERAGIATICLEGVMLIAAWVSAVVTFYCHSHGYGPFVGMTAAMLAGMVFMGVHALLTVGARADHIISGVVVNLLAAGVTPVFSKALFGSTTSTPSIPIEERFSTLAISGLKDIPYVGQLLFDQSALTYLALALPFILSYLIYRSRWGLRLTTCGEHPDALHTAGVSPNFVRVKNLLLGGAVASLGGVYLATDHGSQFTRDMTAGRGYIALTAVIFGKWKPIPTLCACLFFGFADALQIQLQGVSIGDHQFPVQFIQALPYLITLVVLVGFIGESRPPANLGRRL